MNRIALLLLFALSLDARERVVLLYDEQEIDDRDRAQLYEAVAASVPVGQWRVIEVHESASVPAIIDRYYDFWDDPRRDPSLMPFKETVEVLARIIRDANGIAGDAIPAGTRLRIPPLPVRGMLLQEQAIRVRLFDTATHAYAWMESAAAPLPVARDRASALATKEHPYRSARLTAIEVDAASLATLLADERHAIPEGAVLIRSARAARLTLSGDTCDGEAFASFVSTHATAAETALDEARTRLPAILHDDPPPPLRIIDWNVAPETAGHGSKVVSVVREVLERLEMSELLPFVQTFDLNPRNNAAELRATLEAYEAAHRGDNFNRATSKLAFRAAYAWIDRPAAEAGLEHDVNELVLQAVFWRFLFEEPSWLNLSFSVNYPAGQLLDAIFMEGSQSFAVLAAGNLPAPISSGAFPQADAARYPNLVNVTFGRSDGQAIGARTNDAAGGVPVHLLARGCGFAGGTIQPDDAGSSFASPYVAALSWLRYVFDRTAAPDAMRETLLAAVRPAPFEQPSVRSAGVFEPELLFDGEEPHIVLDGRRRPLAGATLLLSWSANGTKRLTGIDVGGTRTGSRLAVFACSANRYCLWLREPAQPVLIRELLGVTIELADGERIALTPGAAAARISDVCF